MPDQVYTRFATSDIGVASFLRCRGFSVVDIGRTGSGRTIFVFASSEELHRTVLDYSNYDCVPVRSFCRTLRDLTALSQ